MNTCNREMSRQYLSGLLTSVEETAFVSHLDECQCCQRWLEQEAGDDEAWRETREILSYSTDTQEHSAAHATVSAEVIGKLSAPVISLLAPSDDPAMLGRVGCYEIVGIIGRGGMGIVLKGFDRVLNRNVAVKVLDPALADISAARQRFAREARAMAAVSHEHVVPVFAVDEQGALPYFVMEYVPGGTLDARLTKEGPFEIVEIVRVGLQVAQALAAAHRQGLVHRDIKPSNILLDTGTERVRVTDFGLARALNDATFTRSGLLAGTPQFMAPEQVRGENCDGQSDLFSLGSVMYAMCTGHPPFRAETVYGVMQRIVHDHPRTIREQNPQIHAWLEDFILKLLSKDKAERFANAHEVVQILEKELAYLQNPSLSPEPTRAWIPSLQQQSTTTRPAFRLEFAMGVAITVLLCTVLWLTGKALTTTGHKNTQDAPNSKSASNVTVPLWQHDGMQALQSEVDQFEASLRTPAPEWLDDPWQQEMHQVRQELRELSESEQHPWAIEKK